MKHCKHFRPGGMFCVMTAFSIAAFSLYGVIYPASSAHAANDNPSNRGLRGQSVSGTADPTPLQVELEALSGYAEDIYDLAKMNRWNKTRKKLDDLKKFEQSLKFNQSEESTFFSVRLRTTIAELEQAISAKNRRDTMHSANKITLLETAMVGPLKPRVPTNVMLLDYCGRELEIWSEEKNIDKLSNIVIRMHLIWQGLMPQLIEQGGTRELKRFSEVMKRLEVAKTPDEYGHLARQVLDEVDNLEKVFKK